MYEISAQQITQNLHSTWVVLRKRLNSIVQIWNAMRNKLKPIVDSSQNTRKEKHRFVALKTSKCHIENGKSTEIESKDKVD